MRPRPKFYWSPHQCADSVARTRKRPRRCSPPTDCAGPSRSPTAITWFNAVNFERLRSRCHESLGSIILSLVSDSDVDPGPQLLLYLFLSPCTVEPLRGQTDTTETLPSPLCWRR